MGLRNFTMAKACTKCRKYTVIHAENLISAQRVSLFEKDHAGHPMVTLPLSEAKSYGYASAESAQARVTRF